MLAIAGTFAIAGAAKAATPKARGIRNARLAIFFPIFRMANTAPNITQEQ